MIITGNEFVWQGTVYKGNGPPERLTGAAQIRVPEECLKICTRVLIKSVYSCINAENENLMYF